jgi:predicted RNA-binding Zn-ribbon protein involved in translation (DUF1610 family)
MARKYGTAGKSARDMALKRELKAMGIAAVMLLLLWFWSQNMASISQLGLPVVIALVFGFTSVMKRLEKKGSHYKKRSGDAERGARGEEKVEEKIMELPDGYESFHDLVFDGFNIDHVIVGPTGVYVVETKSHSGKVIANGDVLLLNGRTPEKDFINQTWSQTYHIRNLLKEHTGKDWPVKPVLCFSRAFVEVRRPVKGVEVVNGGYLTKLITKQKPVLSSDDIAAVVACLKPAPPQPQPDRKSCPQCGNDLVLRMFQSGPRAGEEFYGCAPCKKGWPLQAFAQE